MDVISHIPVLCEDHNIPYIYVPSRAELGAAGSTKRPTSVVMMTPSVGKKGESEGFVKVHTLDNYEAARSIDQVQSKLVQSASKHHTAGRASKSWHRSRRAIGRILGLTSKTSERSHHSATPTDTSFRREPKLGHETRNF